MTQEADRAIQRSPVNTIQDRGNDLPVLSELHHALEALRSDGTETVIDIKSLPLGIQREGKKHLR